MAILRDEKGLFVMSISHWNPRDLHVASATDAPLGSGSVRLHRISTVRRNEGISLRRVARHLHIDVATARLEESETNDMRLSRLYQWQQALEVPVADLLVEGDSRLSSAVLDRARLVKLMKTATSLLERSPPGPIHRLAETLVGQLLEIMPELDGVNPWPAVGQRGSLNRLGRIVERQFPDDMVGA
jgi:transcriptional regulator with XRE-family HTH domain